MDLGKIGKKGLGNLGSGILGNHKKGGIRKLMHLRDADFLVFGLGPRPGKDMKGK